MVGLVNSPPMLAMQGIIRRYDNGTQALAGADLTVHAGEVHGLLGANGAGKSTLVAILAGAERPDGGTIAWRGDKVRWAGPLAPRRAGIATIYQHAPLAPALNARDNILLGDGGWSRRDGARAILVDALIASLGNPFDPGALVSDLAPGARRMVAIAQALASGADLVVMDEPTAALNDRERQAVHAVIRRLAHDQGKAVVLVSHFLDEICALTDRVTVLRDGRTVLIAATATLDEPGLARAITGRSVSPSRAPARPSAEAATNGGLTVDTVYGDGLGPVSLHVAAGEIVGLAGLLGSGRSRLLHTLFGAQVRQGGTIRVDGRAIAPAIAGSMAAGIALVPENRDRQGLFGGFSIEWNIALPPVPGRWRTDPCGERMAAESMIAQLGIRASGPDVAASALSGGNAQKVAIAKWLRPQTRVLLLDEPTAGMDVGARQDVLAQIRRLADEGMAVILASSDFDELLAHASRILILHKGRIVGEADPATHNKADLLVMASTRDAQPSGQEFST